MTIFVKNRSAGEIYLTSCAGNIYKILLKIHVCTLLSDIQDFDQHWEKCQSWTEFLVLNIVWKRKMCWLVGHEQKLLVSDGGKGLDPKHWYRPIIYPQHNDVIKWKHFPAYWPFVGGIQRSPVNSPHKGQWCGALIFSLICVCINGWVNNRYAGNLRRYHAHYDVTIMGRYIRIT